MVNKKKWLRTLVIVLIIGMTIVGCDNGSGNDGGINDAKKITITGLAGKTGGVEIYLSVTSGQGDSGIVTMGQGTISGNSVTVSLIDRNLDPWTGSGSYYMVMYINDDGFIYTNGRTMEVQYNITNATSTIAFSQFVYFKSRSNF
jgi:hypothetical protein